MKEKNNVIPKPIKIEELNIDMVNNPPHYTSGKIEVIDFIEDQKLNYHLGNVVKYICRAGKKSKNVLEDLKKAEWYIKREISKLENEHKNPSHW